MQQLDDSELWKVPQEPPSEEEPMRDVEEGAQSPESPEKADGPAVRSPGGRSEAKSLPQSAPAMPQRPTSANAEENLPNGELQDRFGNDCSPEEANAHVVPVAVGKGDHRPHLGGPEAISAADPAGQSLDPGKAPASRQRKLAMEEMLIRDHLGQEVGCMDAVGQSQGSLEKEEQLEDQTGLEGRGDRGSQPGPLNGVSDANAALGEGPLDCELGSRDGPEGQSPTSCDPQNASGCPQGQGGGPLEVGSLAGGAGGRGVAQKAVPGEGAEETAPTLALATGDAPATESVGQGQGSQMKPPEGQQSGATEERPGPHRPGPPLEQLAASPPHPPPPVPETKALPAQEEAQSPLPGPVRPSSPAQIPANPPEAVPSLQGTEDPLLDQTPLQGDEGSRRDPERSTLPSQSPLPPLDQNSSLPDSDGSRFDPTPPAVQACLPEENPPSSRQDPLPSSLEMKPSDLQGEAPLLPGVECSAKDPLVTSSLPEAEGAPSSWSPTLPGTPTAPLPEQPTAPLPGGRPQVQQRLPPPGPGMEEPATQRGQELPEQEVEGSPADPIPALPGQEVSLLDTGRAALEESPAALQDQGPPPHTPRASSLPEAEAFLPGQAPLPVDDPCEKPLAPLDQIPPALPETGATSPLGKAAAPSLPEADGVLPEEIQAPLPSHASPGLPEAEGPRPAQETSPALGDQTAPARLGQTPSPQEAAKSLPEGQNAPGPLGGRAGRAGHASSPHRGQRPGLQDTPLGPSAGPSPSQETLPPPLPGQSQAAEGLDAAGRGGAREVAEALGDLPAETQPLLTAAKAAGNTAAGALPPKPQVVTSNHTPNDSGYRSSANTAYAHLPRQGQNREPEKGKRKSCQCCVLM